MTDETPSKGRCHELPKSMLKSATPKLRNGTHLDRGHSTFWGLLITGDDPGSLGMPSRKRLRGMTSRVP